MKTIVIITVIVCTLIISSELKGQEVMVSFCSGVETIEAPLAAHLDRFKTYEGFKQAVLFKDSDSSYFMEIHYLEEERMMRQRLAVSENDLNVLCEEIYSVKHLVSGDRVIDTLDQEGRVELILSSMSLSLLYYSWAVPTTFNGGGRAYISSYLLLGGASFFIPYLGTRNKPITPGMARGYSSGGVLGIVHGWGTGFLIMGQELEPTAGLGLSVFTSVGESLIGYNYAKRNNLSLGHMSLTGSGGGWGLAYGLAIPLMAESESARIYGFSTLAGSALGIYAGDKIGKSYHITDGDPVVVNTLGFLGAYLPLALTATIGEDLPFQVYVAGMMIGSFAGMTAGVSKAQKFNYTLEDGMVLSLGTFAGAFTGAGLTYLVGGTNTDARVYMWSIGAGATGSFFLVDHLIRKRESKPGLGSLKIDINPLAYQSLINNNSKGSHKLFTGNQQQNHLFRANLSF